MTGLSHEGVNRIERDKKNGYQGQRSKRPSVRLEKWAKSSVMTLKRQMGNAPSNHTAALLLLKNTWRVSLSTGK